MSIPPDPESMNGGNGKLSLVTDQLASKGIAFETLHHPRTVAAIDEARRLGILPGEVVKTLVIETRSGHILAVIPASRRLDLKLVQQVTGDSHARLATEAEIEGEFPGYELGALPPLGRTLATPVLIDPEVVRHPAVVFAASQTESVRISVADLLRAESWTLLPLVEQEGEELLPTTEEAIEVVSEPSLEVETGHLADP